MVADRTIVVFGAGAVGGYIASRLSTLEPGFRIELVGRPRVVDAVQARGLILREAGAESVTHPHASTSAAQLAPCELVILCVRAYDVQRSLSDVRSVVGEKGLVLAMQNGVGSEEEIAQDLGKDRVLLGTLTASVAMDEPGVVTRRSSGGGMALATMTGSPVPSWLDKAIQDTGLPVVEIPDYRSLRWSKLLLNMMGAAITAILDIEMSDLVADPRLFSVEQQAMGEAGRVMDALGVRTVALPGYPVPLARLLMRSPSFLARRTIGVRLARARGGGSPTMRTDMARGRTEVTYTNGAVASAAARLGLQAPVNRALAALTVDLAEHPQHRASFRHNADALLNVLEKEAGGSPG